MIMIILTSIPITLTSLLPYSLLLLLLLLFLPTFASLKVQRSLVPIKVEMMINLHDVNNRIDISHPYS